MGYLTQFDYRVMGGEMILAFKNKVYCLDYLQRICMILDSSGFVKMDFKELFKLLNHLQNPV